MRIQYYLLGLLPFLIYPNLIHGQSNPDQTKVEERSLSEQILYQDSLFWEAYNTCDLAGMEVFFSEDIEFFHDKAGYTSSAASLIEALKTGLCSEGVNQVERRKVAGTIAVFPLNNYGAIIRGEHTFHVMENGQATGFADKAQFTHIWKNESGKWVMTRVISYDHQDLHGNQDKQITTLSPETLTNYTGVYEAPNTGSITITVQDKGLKIVAGEMQMFVEPESETVFFNAEMPLTFEFVKDETGKVLKFLVRENGNVVEEALKQE
ncbi:MAG: DUF4440 domain-containing protein [Bacteroidia bacterium]